MNLSSAYITAAGCFLPGEPVANDAIENHLGLIHGQSSPLKATVLRQNRIKTRHYAIDAHGHYLHTNAEMAAHAIHDALSHAELSSTALQYLTTSTTQNDLIVPGLASQVHHLLGLRPLEIASHQSVCASSMMALKSACLQVKSGEATAAAVSGSEFSSRWFRPGFYEATFTADEYETPPFETEFLRFTLSDGAGALIVESQPNRNTPSLKIDWITLRSFADRFPPCMFAGSADNHQLLPWSHYSSPSAAASAGAIILKQDFKLLYQMFPVWTGYYLELIDQGKIQPQEIDYFLAHYSAHSLRTEMIKLLEHTGGMIPEERWFTNLYSKGNTGAASIFIMLEELLNGGSLKAGQKILCFVPESGQCIASFMLLTVV